MSGVAPVAAAATGDWSVVELAAREGWSVKFNQPVPHLSDEYNHDHQWTATRLVKPFESRHGIFYWDAPTPAEAIARGKAAISPPIPKE